MPTASWRVMPMWTFPHHPVYPLHGIPTPPHCPLTPVSCFQSVMNMMHVISIPYALMKVNPLSWIQKVCQYKGALGGCC